jgi:hypothetical protein
MRFQSTPRKRERITSCVDQWYARGSSGELPPKGAA